MLMKRHRASPNAHMHCSLFFSLFFCFCFFFQKSLNGRDLHFFLVYFNFFFFYFSSFCRSFVLFLHALCSFCIHIRDSHSHLNSHLKERLRCEKCKASVFGLKLLLLLLLSLLILFGFIWFRCIHVFEQPMEKSLKFTLFE